jgi:hypothetical protein
VPKPPLILKLALASCADAGGFILRSAVRELSRAFSAVAMVPVPERDFTSARSVALITPLEGSERSELIIDTDSPQQQRWSNETARKRLQDATSFTTP